MAGSMPVPPLYRDAAEVRPGLPPEPRGRPLPRAEPPGLGRPGTQNRRVCGGPVVGTKAPAWGVGARDTVAGCGPGLVRDSEVFADRDEAGRALGEHLRSVSLDDPVVLALPRGGVPVAARVAEALHAPLDVMVVRKVGVPHRPELAMGAVSEEGARIVEEHVTRAAHVPRREYDVAEQAAIREVARLARALRGDRPPMPLAGRTVVVVDDGVATGSTARAACRAARSRGAATVVFAAPVGPTGCTEELRGRRRRGRRAEDAASTSVRSATGTATSTRSATPRSPAELARLGPRRAPAPQERPATLERRTARPSTSGSSPATCELSGHLCPPAEGAAWSCSSTAAAAARRSPRNRYVAQALSRAGLGTLLFDLLTRRGGARPGQRLRHPAARAAAAAGDRLAAQPRVGRRPRPPPSATSVRAPERPRR